MEIFLIFPSICQSIIKGQMKGSSCEKYPCDVTMSIFELEGLQVQRNFPLISTLNFGRNLGDVSAFEFPNSFSTA